MVTERSNYIIFRLALRGLRRYTEGKRTVLQWIAP
jgi:hypothetical protein